MSSITRPPRAGIDVSYRQGNERIARFLSFFPGPGVLGFIGSLLVAVTSYLAGVIRFRNSLADDLNLSYLTFGHGYLASNFVFVLGLSLLIIAWLKLGRMTVIDARPSIDKRRRAIDRCLFVWLFPLLFSAPIMSRDSYSYLMQGAMVRDGFNPYEKGAIVDPGPYLGEVSSMWRNTTTPYGPLHLWIGEGITSIVGSNVSAGLVCYRILSVAGFLVIMWSVPRIAQALNGDPAMALWLGVANPMMLIHLVGGMHNEAVMVALMTLGVFLALKHRYAVSIALLALAISVKAPAAIAVPFVVWMATNYYSRKNGRRFVAFLVSGLVAVVETLVIMQLINFGSGLTWQWIFQISGNSVVVVPLSLPTIISDVATPFIHLFDPSFHYNAMLATTRKVFSLVMVIGVAVTWWVFRGDDRRNVIGIACASFVAYVTNAVAFPWYFASVIAFLGVICPPLWVVNLSVGGSVALALFFTGTGDSLLYKQATGAAILIAGWLATFYVCPVDVANRPGWRISRGQTADAQLPSLSASAQPAPVTKENQEAAPQAASEPA